MASALLPAAPRGSLRNSCIAVAIRAITSMPSSKAKVPVTLQVWGYQPHSFPAALLASRQMVVL